MIAGYQFVVYGEHLPEGFNAADAFFTGGRNGRKITAFSQEVFVAANEVRSSPPHPFSAAVVLLPIKSTHLFVCIVNSTSSQVGTYWDL